MSTIKKNYNIHNLLTFRVISDTNKMNNVLNSIFVEYKNFECNEITRPDFTIYLHSFNPSYENCNILDNKYYVKEDYIYCEDSYKIAKWKVEISGLEKGNTCIHISPNLCASMIISGFLIDPLINFKLNEKGYSLIHGSCISKGNKACLFTSQGGGGKTSTALYAVENGFKFLGDNFIILSKGDAFSFLTPLNIFSFNLIPFVRKKMGFKRRSEYLIKNILYMFLKVRIVTKINVKEIFPQSLDNKSKVESMFLLMPKNKVDIEIIGKSESIKHMTENMKLDSLPFIKYMLEYSYMFPHSIISTHWTRYEENLRNNLLDSTHIYRAEVPTKYNLDVYARIIEVIKSVTNP